LLTFESGRVGPSPVVGGRNRANAPKCDLEILRQANKGISFRNIVASSYSHQLLQGESRSLRGLCLRAGDIINIRLTAPDHFL
jgi:hypothetical protein